jgi:hypothetical protein
MDNVLKIVHYVKRNELGIMFDDRVLILVCRCKPKGRTCQRKIENLNLVTETDRDDTMMEICNNLERE